ncbi:uncharacterized protein LOC111674064 [Orussus abietinus]|uniref:uncharacterized protein LOC111674064 n=1 Tax=Orussus abietinus TaxID=222816 RepID=UPI000C716030|nr:uncharacterized protein LOC111674064 [Orussus abietinus]
MDSPSREAVCSVWEAPGSRRDSRKCPGLWRTIPRVGYSTGPREFPAGPRIAHANFGPCQSPARLQPLGGDRAGSILGAVHGGGILTFRGESGHRKPREEVHRRRAEAQGTSGGLPTGHSRREAAHSVEKEMKLWKENTKMRTMRTASLPSDFLD